MEKRRLLGFGLVGLLIGLAYCQAGDTRVGGGEEFLSFQDCEGYEYTNSSYIANLSVSLSCEIPTIGEPCAATLTGFVKQDFFVDYLHVIGKYYGQTVLD